MTKVVTCAAVLRLLQVTGSIGRWVQSNGEMLISRENRRILGKNLVHCYFVSQEVTWYRTWDPAEKPCVAQLAIVTFSRSFAFLLLSLNVRPTTGCKIWGFHSGDYEECRLLGYTNPVHTSQETHYVSATEPSQLMLCKIWGFHSGDYEECHLPGNTNPVRTSQETYYVSTTESSRLIPCKIWGFHSGD
jgi:hypothetical protein